MSDTFPPAHGPEPGSSPVPGRPVSFDKTPGASPGPLSAPATEVGAFRPGSPASRTLVSRYLVGTALAQSVNRGLWLFGVALLVLAGVLWAAGWHLLAVLPALVAIAVLIVRMVFRAVLDRVLIAGLDPQARGRLGGLVGQTRKDVLRELRRVGLPGRDLTLPLLGLRLVRPSRRADALARLQRFELDRVVPAARVDELHLMLRSAGARAR